MRAAGEKCDWLIGIVNDANAGVGNDRDQPFGRDGQVVERANIKLRATGRTTVTAIDVVIFALPVECDAEPDTRTRRSGECVHCPVEIDTANPQVQRIGEINAARTNRDTGWFVNRAARCRNRIVDVRTRARRDRPVHGGDFSQATVSTIDNDDVAVRIDKRRFWIRQC